MIELPGDVVSFGLFKLSRSDCRLMRKTEDGDWLEIPLRPKAFDLLRYLVENPGRLVSQDELLDRLWPKIHVQADGLKGHVLTIRAALGDNPNNPVFIETVRGRGYRFIAPILAQQQDSRRDVARLLVGRGSARRELETLLRRTASTEAVIGFVTGEPGIGKTALVGEFATMLAAAKIPVVVCHCIPQYADRDAYYPVLEALTELARLGVYPDFVSKLATLAPSWLIQLPWLMPPAVVEETRQKVFGTTSHRVNRELCDLLDNVAKEMPLVLVLEDIHWADQATLDLINVIATRRLQTRLFVLSTMRLSGSSPSAKAARTLCQTLSLYHLAKEISLDPLTEEEVGSYLAAIAGAPPPDLLSRQLHTRSEGNPLFMTAMLDHLMHEGIVTLEADGWAVADRMDEAARRAPPSLAQIIESEVEKLDPDAQAVLEAGSVCEGSFSAPISKAATTLDEARFEVICEHLCRTTALIQRAEYLTFPQGPRVQHYAFRHMVFRDVVYERQSVTRRAAAHLAIGNRIEDVYRANLSAVATLLVENFMIGERWDAAIRYLGLVAQNALQRFSAREAAATLEQALALTPKLAPEKQTGAQVELLEDLARAYAGSLDARARETYAKLADLAAKCGKLEIECRALLGLGFTFAWNDLDRSRAVLGEAIDKSAALEDPIARARIRTFAHGWRSWLAGWSETDAVACTAALDEIRASGNMVALNASLVDYCLILFPSSHYRQSHDTIESCFNVLVSEGLEKRADISLPLWILRLGRPWTLMCAGDFGIALDLFSSGVRQFLDNGDVGRAATLQFYQGFCHVHMQDHQGALDLCNQALAFCDVNGSMRLSPNEQQIERVVRGLAELGAGRIDKAMDLFAAACEGMQRWQTLTTWHWRMALEWGMADAHLALGQIEQAQLHARQFHDLAYAIRERTWRALASETCARIALRTADPAAAKAHLLQGWKETEAGELKLAVWRLHAAEAAVAEYCGDGRAAELHGAAWKAALEDLADSLPEGHIGRRTIMGAIPGGI